MTEDTDTRKTKGPEGPLSIAAGGESLSRFPHRRNPFGERSHSRCHPWTMVIAIVGQIPKGIRDQGSIAHRSERINLRKIERISHLKPPCRNRDAEEATR